MSLYMGFLKNICFITVIAVSILFCGCVRESDIPPGCNTPPTPTIKPISKTILYEGQYLELAGVPAEGLDGGTYEWEGPNGYFSEGKNVTVPYVTGKHNGDFKFYYLDKNKCRSQAAVMRVIVYTYVNSCSIPENRIRDEEFLKDYQFGSPVESFSPKGNYVVTGGDSNVNYKITFPYNKRPDFNRTYKIYQDTGEIMKDTELAIEIYLEKTQFNVVPYETKRVFTFIDNGKLHIVFCAHRMQYDSGPLRAISGNIVVQ